MKFAVPPSVQHFSKQIRHLATLNPVGSVVRSAAPGSFIGFLRRLGRGWLACASLSAAGAPLSLDSSRAEGEFIGESAPLESVSAVANTAMGEWLLAPIPTLAPGQGFGLQVVAARIYHEPGAMDTTPATVVGVAGVYTQEKCFALGGGYLGHLRDDLWRLTLGGGYMRINSKFYGIGSNAGSLGFSVPIEQRAAMGLGQLMRRVRPGLYVGLRTLAGKTETTARVPVSAPISLPELALKSDLLAAGPVMQWDDRDSTFAPTKGTLLDLQLDVFAGSFHYRSTTLAVNHYQAVAGGVLAVRGYAQTIDGQAPFFALCSFGQGSDLRGYTSGRYRDYAMAAAQAEYRWKLASRWGLVAFAGAGKVGPSLGSLSTSRLLSSLGAGVRFRLTEQNPVNLRFDCAWGRDGGAIYFGVGEAF